MMNEVVVRRSFLDRAGSREELVARYEEHVAEVREALPSSRLLVWSPKEGWEPLCDFFDVSMPAEPFPRVNDRVDFFRLFVDGDADVGGGTGSG